MPFKNKCGISTYGMWHFETWPYIKHEQNYVPSPPPYFRPRRNHKKRFLKNKNKIPIKMTG
jgi:hypothetical protein